MRDNCPYPMPTPETVCSMGGLLYFIWEREAIRLARENGHSAPWTKDPVLAKYKFTNIHWPSIKNINSVYFGQFYFKKVFYNHT